MNKTLELLIKYQKVDDLKSNSHNARTHSKRQIRQIADSIEQFGFINPVLLDGESTLIAGHGRVAAAKLLGMSHVPTIQIGSLSPNQIRAYVVADNRLAEKAGWDRNILAIELQHLMTIKTDLDVTITGFEVPEIDMILGSPGRDADDTFEIEDAHEPITQPGDVWLLGTHRVVCGSAIDQQSFAKILSNKRASVVFSDPPFNVPIAGHVSGNGSVHHREFQMASGEMNEFEFISFLTASLRFLARYSTKGSVHFLCMDWRHVGELLSAGRQVYSSFINLCVWVKNCPGMGTFYRSQHELVLVFRNGEAHRNNVQLGRFGRNRTNVWNYSSANSFSKVSDEGNLLALHPTVKPVALIADALLDCSARNEVVLDAFLGSGSTIIAAERTGRSCCGIEIDPIYVDTAVKRWQRYTGDHAVHAVSGKTFQELTNKQSEKANG